MDDRAALSARAAPDRLRLRHRWLLLCRHRARRRDAHRRHGCDERLSQGFAGQDRRRQWPHFPAGYRYAANRLRRCHARSFRRPRSRPRHSNDRGAGRCVDDQHGLRARARRAGSRHQEAARHRRQCAAGHARRVRQGGRRRNRPKDRRESGPASRRQDQGPHSQRPADPVRRRAAQQSLSGHGDLPDGDGGVRQSLRLYAAAGGARLLQQGQ